MIKDSEEKNLPDQNDGILSEFMLELKIYAGTNADEKHSQF